MTAAANPNPQPTVAEPVRPAAAVAPAASSRRVRRSHTTLSAQGEPLVWLFGGALAIATFMIVGLLGYIVWQGMRTFWPQPIVELALHDGSRLMGEVTRVEQFEPTEEALEQAPAEARRQVVDAGGVARRRLLRTGNFELSGKHFTETPDFQVAGESQPEWAMVLEREEWGRFYGVPTAFNVDGQAQATDPADILALFQRHHGEVREKFEQRRIVESKLRGQLSRQVEEERIGLRQAELDHGVDSEGWREQQARLAAAAEREQTEGAALDEQVFALNREIDRYEIVLHTSSGDAKPIPLAQIVRAYPANRLSWSGKMGVYLSRWGEFLSANPRNSNSEGGVFPAIFGTVILTLIMCVVVTPLGVLAALFLREYAKAGWIVSVVRISIGNLAGVPSIVYGMFGLGFFCYIVGGDLIDPWLFEARLPHPTYGKEALVWASLTLALLTLPVAIVATEEALAAVPNSMREGSYACGASKWQTVRRIVLPRALPGLMTGVILAMSRGAGEVAPLMLVGAAKVAEDLPIDAEAPYFHPDRKFMHLGFHIYDLGFQSPDSEAARPMVFTTTLLLVAIVAALNFAAMYLRARLRRRYASSNF